MKNLDSHVNKETIRKQNQTRNLTVHYIHFGHSDFRILHIWLIPKNVYRNCQKLNIPRYINAAYQRLLFCI